MGRHEYERAVGHSGLPPGVRAVLLMLARLADPRTLRLARSPSQAEIAAATGQARRTVNRNLALACNAGYVVRVPHPYNRSIGKQPITSYVLVTPTVPPEPNDHRTPAVPASPVDNPGAGTPTVPPGGVTPKGVNLAQERIEEEGTVPRGDEQGAGFAGALVTEAAALGYPITPERALAVAGEVLGGREVRDRLAYIRAALRREPERYLGNGHEPGGPRPAHGRVNRASMPASAPPWCWAPECDPRTRLRERADGKMMRCPACHPKAAESLNPDVPRFPGGRP